MKFVLKELNHWLVLAIFRWEISQQSMQLLFVEKKKQLYTDIKIVNKTALGQKLKRTDGIEINFIKSVYNAQNSHSSG